MLRKRNRFTPRVEGLDHRAAASSLAVAPDVGLMASLVNYDPSAPLTFDDGAEHVIAEPTGPIKIGVDRFDTTLVIEDGAKVVGLNLDEIVPCAINAVGGSVVLRGGEVLCSDLNRGNGIYIESGSFEASGGYVCGGFYLTWPVSVSISGGTFDGSGMHLGGGHATISGGTFHGGQWADGSSGYALTLIESGGNIDISGGNFEGKILLAIADHSSLSSTVTFHGSGLQYSPKVGMLSGTLENGDSINVQIVQQSSAWPFVVSGSGSEVLFHGTSPA